MQRLAVLLLIFKRLETLKRLTKTYNGSKQLLRIYILNIRTSLWNSFKGRPIFFFTIVDVTFCCLIFWILLMDAPYNIERCHDFSHLQRKNHQLLFEFQQTWFWCLSSVPLYDGEWDNESSYYIIHKFLLNFAFSILMKLSRSNGFQNVTNF